MATSSNPKVKVYDRPALRFRSKVGEETLRDIAECLRTKFVWNKSHSYKVPVKKVKFVDGLVGWIDA